MKNSEIREINEHYNEEFASFIFLILNTDRVITKTNAFTRKILGFDPVSKKPEDIFVTFNEEFDIGKLAQKNETQKLMNIHTFSGLPQSFYFNFRKTGEWIVILGNLDALEVEALRRDLQKMNNELNALTRDLAKKNAELKKLNELKNQFLGMAAHDLRRPVGAVISYSEFLLEEISTLITPEQISYLNIIDQSANYMKSIIDDFLGLSTIESGNFLLEKEEHNIEKVLQDCLNFHQLNLKKKKITIEINKREPVPNTGMDRNKIEHVMNNIISNSVKYAPEGSLIEIEIRKRNNEILMAFKDQGPGIPEDLQETIFQPFVTGVTPGGKKKGTGLGLVIASRIVQAHKGEIWVDSKINEGFTFYFSLPIQ